jgi:hypothetical protein
VRRQIVSIGRRIDGWLINPVPAARLGVFRILVGAYAAVWSMIRLPEHLALARHTEARWEPVGVLAPLPHPPADWAIVVLALVVPVLAAAFAAGWRYRVIGPVTALALLALLTFASSWGQIFHTENLLALHVVVLAGAPAAAVLSLDARRAGSPSVGDSGRYGWPLRVAALVTVATYLLAGWAKLRTTGVAWVDGDVLRRLVIHDNLRKELLGDTTSPLAATVVSNAWLFSPLAVLALVVELGAPFALAGRRIRDAWVATAWLFHLGVLSMMAVLFPYHLVGLAFAPLYPLERVERRWLSARRRRRR